jgi:NCAIR mutase (PurE)-related protein
MSDEPSRLSTKADIPDEITSVKIGNFRH